MTGGLIPQNKAADFICAGNATFTLKSLKTGTRYTYKAEYMEQFGVKKLFVKLLSGPDNVNNYHYMCAFKLVDGMPLLFNIGKRFGADAPAFKAFKFVFYALMADVELPDLEIWHEGKCCRCGRKLTVPESIETGMGPECSGKAAKFSNHE